MQTVQNTIAENFGKAIPGNDMAAKENQFSLDQVPDLSGKVAVVTGGSEGIGYGCVHTLLSHNIAKLFVLSNEKAVAEGAMEALKDDLGTLAGDKVDWMDCDLSDWEAVGRAAFEISDRTNRLDIVINNAGRGIMTAQKNKNGVDLHMATNHMGHVVLTSHLLPLLKETASKGNTVRIVNLGSNAHESSPKDTRFESLDELNQDLGPMAQYGRSKLAGILYAKYLARHLTKEHPNILANATHPGFVETKQSVEHIKEPYPVLGYLMSHGLAPFKKTQFEGAVSTMYAATVVDKSGLYICPPATVEEGSELANDEALGERLMDLTWKIVKDKTERTSSAKGCPFKEF